MRRALFFIVAVCLATSSFASIPRASALIDASSLFDPLPQTRIRVSEDLAPFERPAPSLLSRALRQSYKQASTTNTSGLAGFLSVDPVLDVKTALHRPQSWNRYSYAFNSPLTFKDPDGRLVNLATMDDQDRSLLIDQLRQKTGLDLDYQDGNLVSNGVLRDASGKALGSATARTDLLKAINSEQTYYGIGRNNSASVNTGRRVGSHLNLDFADIAKVNTGDNNPATFDAASIFLHELSHAFGLKDPLAPMLSAMPTLKGAVVERDNKIRAELGLPPRLQYLTVKDSQGRYYIPFGNGPVYVPTGDH